MDGDRRQGVVTQPRPKRVMNCSIWGRKDGSGGRHRLGHWLGSMYSAHAREMRAAERGNWKYCGKRVGTGLDAFVEERSRQRIPTAETPTQKVAVSEIGGRRSLAFSERATHSDNKGKAKKSVQVRKVLITMQIEGFNHGIFVIWYIHLCHLATPRKFHLWRVQGKEDWKTWKSWETFPSLECLHVHRQVFFSQCMSTKSQLISSIKCILDAHNVNQWQRHLTCRSLKKTAPPDNLMEETLRHEEDLRFCPLKVRDRIFEESVARIVQHYNMCARRIVNPLASLLMKVTTESTSNEQKEKGENVQEADFCCPFDRLKVYIRWDVL